MEKVIGRENAAILLATGSKNIINTVNSSYENWRKLTKNNREYK